MAYASPPNVANPNVSAGYITSYQLQSYLSSGMPVHLAGVVEAFPEEAQEMDVLIPLITGAYEPTAVPDRIVFRWRQQYRNIPPITMDTVGGLPGALGSVTFKSTQNSTAPWGSGNNAWAKAPWTIHNPVHQTIALITNVVVNGPNDVDITVLPPDPTVPFVPIGQTLPAGQTLFLVAPTVPEISDTVEFGVADWSSARFGMNEHRVSVSLSGRTAASNLSWVAGPDGKSGTWIPNGLGNKMKENRQWHSRAALFSKPVQTAWNTFNPGYDAFGACGLFPMVDGEHPDIPGGIIINTGGTMTLNALKDFIDEHTLTDGSCREFMLVCDYQFNRNWADFVRGQSGTANGTFSITATDSRYSTEEKQTMQKINLNFNTVEYMGYLFHVQQARVFSNGAGLGGANSAYYNSALIIPRTDMVNTITGDPVPRCEVIYSASSDGSYKRFEQIWMHGNPFLFKTLAPAMETKEAAMIRMGANGQDKAAVELLSERGYVWNGTYEYGRFVS